MNRTYVEIERQKLADKGYKSAVSSVIVKIDKNIVNMNIGNDIYLLTGIKASKEDMLDNVHTVAISSAINAVKYTQQEMLTLGTAINNIFKGYLVIQTIKDNITSNVPTDVPAYQLEFIRITPIK